MHKIHQLKDNFVTLINDVWMCTVERKPHRLENCKRNANYRKNSSNPGLSCIEENQWAAVVLVVLTYIIYNTWGQDYHHCSKWSYSLVTLPTSGRHAPCIKVNTPVFVNLLPNCTFIFIKKDHKMTQKHLFNGIKTIRDQKIVKLLN